MENIKIRCKVCNTELESHPSQLKTCGCPNMTSIRVDKISAVDLSKVIIVNGYNNRSTNHLSNQDLQFQEERRKRKVRKLDFEVR